MAPRIKAHLALIGTNLFFASNYSAIKFFTSNNIAGALGINIIRLGVSLVLFWGLFLFKPSKTIFQKKDWIALLLCAFAAITLNQLLFIKGLSLSFPIHSALLTLITPILITLLAVRMLNEKLSLTKLAGLLLGISGAILLISEHKHGAPGDNILLGDFLVILSSIAYTFYFILVKPLMDRHEPVIVVRWIFTFGFFFTLPLCYHEFTEIQWQSFTVQHWFLLFMIVVPGTSLAYLFNVYGIKILSASTAGAYIYSQPIFAVIIAMIFLQQKLSPIIIIAGVLIFSGVWLSNRKPRIILLE
ncbi:MAG: DMT family transporter [Ginsengibacter sp.]